MTKQPMNRYDRFRALGQSGAAPDIDTLMGHLHEQVDFATTRLVDFALGLVDTHEGAGRIRHYLFHGGLIQRNYAALYFKRRQEMALLHEAVAQGKIDEIQAYLR
ncbi:Transcriptional regulator, MarR family (fragment) [Candidatus Promineifilum breve]|uniref:Transcriptional regulator, MarR family n=1 Tax=Candidatus Promineifilum breve TaxID=1806508 RepID=A0A160T5Q2_9CHLR